MKNSLKKFKKRMESKYCVEGIKSMCPSSANRIEHLDLSKKVLAFLNENFNSNSYEITVFNGFVPHKISFKTDMGMQLFLLMFPEFYIQDHRGPYERY